MNRHEQMIHQGNPHNMSDDGIREHVAKTVAALADYSISDLLHAAFARLRALDTADDVILNVTQHHLSECVVAEILRKGASK